MIRISFAIIKCKEILVWFKGGIRGRMGWRVLKGFGNFMGIFGWVFIGNDLVGYGWLLFLYG